MRPLKLLLAALLALTACRASAFALLGPFAPWMTTPLAYQIPNAIGGPMQLGEGYRWNVPVITYAYDQSFLNYFGTNGIAAVESAIQIFNNLPPASAQTNLSIYPLKTSRVNFVAQSEGLQDLKSQTLVMLIEQLGLARPSASAWVLRNFSFNPTNSSATYSIENRNYDPVQLQPSPVVNGQTLGFEVLYNTGSGLLAYGEGSSNATFASAGGSGYYLPDGDAIALEYTEDPERAISAVADNESGSRLYGFGLESGYFYMGFTSDDFGGLAYLYSTNNIALENLLPGVHGTGANTTNFVTQALRPGVDKITFQQLTNFSPTNFVPVTNQYTDTYITNGVAQQQILERVITQPDILFTVKYQFNATQANVSRTGTTNWVNNGLSGHDGPGVIQPPIVINFNRSGPSLYFNNPTYPSPYGGEAVLPLWATFDGTTNSPIVLSDQSATNSTPTEFHFLLYSPPVSYGQPPANFTWNLPGQFNSLLNLQTSTNLTDWLTIATLTNQGGTFTYEDVVFTNTPQRYFRTVPQ